jgi:VanZ family protein
MGNRRLTAAVTLAYLSMIVYASLSPFSGWRMPAENILGFLVQPWPRYVIGGDIALNVTAYLPFGFLVCVALRSKLDSGTAAIAAAALGTLLSLCMESVQMFLPMRIASKVDLLTNAAGSLLGAIIAWRLARLRNRDNLLGAAWRASIRSGALGDAGLLIVALWIAIQFHPAPFLFSSGDLREVFQFAPYFSHTPRLYLLAESAVVAMATAAIGLLVSLVLQPLRHSLLPVLLVVLLALVVRAAAAFTFARSPYWLQWLTPGAETGLALAIVALAVLLRFSPASRALAALLFTAFSVLSVNLTPGNPYHTPLALLSGPPQTPLLSLNSLLHGASVIWPWLAAVYLVAVYRAERARVASAAG